MAKVLEGIRVVLIDGCPALRFGLGTLISAEGVHVVGETGIAEDALELVRSLSPDFVILDPDLWHREPETANGILPEIDLSWQIKAFPEPPFIIVYTNRNSFADLAAFTLSGADHYVHKSTVPEKLIETGKRILAGERAWLPGLDQVEAGKRLLAAAKVNCLTCKEKQVFGLMLRRYTNSQIAETLNISLQTTKNHVGNVLRKLDCEKRSDLFTL